MIRVGKSYCSKEGLKEARELAKNTPNSFLLFGEIPFCFISDRLEEDFCSSIEKRHGITIIKVVPFCDEESITLASQGFPCDVLRGYSEWLKKFTLWTDQEWLAATGYKWSLIKTEWINDPTYNFETVYYAGPHPDVFQPNQGKYIQKRIITDPKTFTGERNPQPYHTKYYYVKWIEAGVLHSTCSKVTEDEAIEIAIKINGELSFAGYTA